MNLNSIDLLFVYRMVSSRVRGFVWSRLFGLFRKTNLGQGIKCFKWPRVIFSSSSLVIGDFCAFGSVTFNVAPNACLTLGRNVSINDYSIIAANKSIYIGDDCLIGESVSIRDSDHDFKQLDMPIKLQGHISEAIRIDNNVWISRGVAILKGVHIGEGSVIGANAVVLNDIPAYSVAVGVPAKVIRSRKELKIQNVS